MNNEPYTSLYYDSEGQLADLEPVRPTSADDVRAVLQRAPLLRTVRSKSLRINTPSEEDIFAADIFPRSMRILTSPVINVAVTYQGFRRVNGQDAAVFATKMNLIVDPFDLFDKEWNPVTYESGVVETTEFFDPTHGYLIASYGTVVMRGSSSTKGPFQILLVRSDALDRSRSKGLPRP